MKAKKPQSQRRKLIAAAHMVEADHDEAAFEKRLRKIAKPKPATKRRPKRGK